MTASSSTANVRSFSVPVWRMPVTLENSPLLIHR
jgi:hypothetical protein